MAWMKSALVSLLVLSLHGCARSPRPSNEAPPRADTGAIEQFHRTYGFRLGRPKDITMLSDGKQALYLRSGPSDTQYSLYLFDARNRSERLLASASSLLRGEAATVSVQDEATKERLRSHATGLSSYRLSPDERTVLTSTSGQLFLVRLDSGAHRKLRTSGYASQARFSPDGRWVSYVVRGNLMVTATDGTRQVRLTRDASNTISNATPDFIAQEEMGRFEGYWWSPDSSKIAFQRTDTQSVRIWYRHDPRFPDQPPKKARYPQAGTDNADVQLWLVEVPTGRKREVPWDHRAFPYLAQVTWTEGAPLTVVLQDRLQKKLGVFSYDERARTLRPLVTETSDTWINLDLSCPKWLPDGNAFLWSTERNGAWELELRSRRGEKLRSILPPRAGYRRTLGVDDQGTHAWVLASREPTEQHVLRLSLNDGGFEPWTTAPGSHRASRVSHRYWALEERSQRGEWNARIMEGKQAIATVPSVAQPAPYIPHVEWHRVGPRQVRTAVVKPRSFDPEQTYPVLVYAYAGPGFRIVHAFPHAYHRQQVYADAGYIVVLMDARGTPDRGVAWERATYQNLLDIPISDQVEALQELPALVPQLDLARVGVFGWSFGGTFAAAAVMKRPDVFHAAVAGAPGVDWRDYDTHYTERYLGLPSENEDVYDRNSLLTLAPSLTRPLLLVHGAMDDNVYYAHAAKLSDALFRAGKPHTLLTLSGATHMAGSAETETRLTQRTIDFFDQHVRDRRAPSPPRSAGSP